MPKDLKDHIKSLPAHHRDQVWVSCRGESPADRETLGDAGDYVEYFPSRGFPSYFYPYLNTKGYLSPLVAVKFLRPAREFTLWHSLNIPVNFGWSAWGQIAGWSWSVGRNIWQGWITGHMSDRSIFEKDHVLSRSSVWSSGKQVICLKDHICYADDLSYRSPGTQIFIKPIRLQIFLTDGNYNRSVTTNFIFPTLSFPLKWPFSWLYLFCFHFKINLSKFSELSRYF